MQTAVPRWQAAGGVALVMASVVAVAPITSRAVELPIVSMSTRLVDTGESILNIPLNLFYDVVNIPYNEVQALQNFAESMLFSGPWLVTSSTNIWGLDPGDPGHFESIVQMLVPFSELNGMNAGEFDWTAGLGQQFAGFLAAEAPVSASCDAEACLPIIPTSPITGFTGIDQPLWWSQILTGAEQFPLLNNWFQIPISQLLNGYFFGPDNYPGYVDPSGPAFSFPDWGLEGTKTVDGVQDVMPWGGTTYTLDLAQPFENFFNSLMAAPPTDGILGTGIQIPTLTEVTQTIQALLASLVVAFDPFTPGSLFCAGDCSLITDLHLDYPDIVKAMSNGNPIIDQWLAAYYAGPDGGTANVPTPEQILDNIAALQQGTWDFQNGSPPADWGFDNSTVYPFFEQLWTELGVYHPADAADATGALDFNALLNPTALTSLLDVGGLSDLSSQLSNVVSSLLTELDTTLATSLGALPLDLLGAL